MDDALLFIHGFMKLALVVGIMVLVATAPSHAHATAHGQQSVAAQATEDDQDDEPSWGRRMLHADDDRWLEADDASPRMNIDGTPMAGNLDICGISTATAVRRLCGTTNLLSGQGFSSSYGSTPSAVASFSMLSTEMFRTWRSTCATKVLCRPASKAKASWESSLVRRSETTFAASRARALTLFFD